MANTAYSNFIQNIRNVIFIRQQKMVANGKLHSLLKIIFLSCWCFLEYRVRFAGISHFTQREGAARFCNSVDHFIILID